MISFILAQITLADGGYYVLTPVEMCHREYILYLLFCQTGALVHRIPRTRPAPGLGKAVQALLASANWLQLSVAQQWLLHWLLNEAVVRHPAPPSSTPLTN